MGMVRAVAGSDSGQSPGVGGRDNRMLRWYAIGLLIGVVQLLVTGIVPSGNAIRSVASIVLGLAMLLSLVLAGRAARQASLRPSWQGALVGVCYGVPAGLASVLFPLTPAQVAASLQKAQQRLHLTSAQLQVAQQHADSAAAHWESFVTGIVVSVLLGLLLGWIGSLFGRGAEEYRAV